MMWHGTCILLVYDSARTGEGNDMRTAARIYEQGTGLLSHAVMKNKDRSDRRLFLVEAAMGY